VQGFPKHGVFQSWQIACIEWHASAGRKSWAESWVKWRNLTGSARCRHSHRSVATSRIYIGIGLPLVFLPIIAASYDGIAPNKTDMASALINAARNIGGSIGISLANNVLAHREQFHQSRLVEFANPTTTQYQDTLKQLMDYFTAHGSSLAQAQQQAFAWIGQQMQAQAAFLAYVDVFWTLAVVSLAAVPLALILRKVKLGGPAPAAH
jgi:DHA2 family multidrug resistance protein